LAPRQLAQLLLRGGLLLGSLYAGELSDARRPARPQRPAAPLMQASGASSASRRPELGMAADVCAGHLQAVDVAKRTTEVAGVKRGSRMCSSLEAAAAWGRSRANKWSVVSERPAHTEAPSSSARPQFHGEQRPIPNRDGVEASAESGGVSSTATTSPPFATSTSTSTSTTTRTRVHNRLGEGQTISFADACPPSVRVHKFLLLLSLYLFLFFAHTGAATEPCSVRICKLLLMRPLCLFLLAHAGAAR
jgi:hypothetical protein